MAQIHFVFAAGTKINHMYPLTLRCWKPMIEIHFWQLKLVKLQDSMMQAFSTTYSLCPINIATFDTKRTGKT
jgi:hypothetical protein